MRIVRLGPATLEVPVPTTLDLPALLLTGAAMIAIFRLKIGMIPVLLGAAGLGGAWHLATAGL